MQEEVLFPTIWNIVLYIFMIFIDVKIWIKYKIRKNEIVLMLFYAFLFMILQLTFIILNNLLEYIFEVLYIVPNFSGFPFQIWIHAGDLGNSMLLIANLFMMRFYMLVFVKQQDKFKKILYFYSGITLALIVSFLFILRLFIDEENLAVIKYGLIVLHSLFIQLPLIINSLRLRRKLIIYEGQKDEGNKLLFIAAMSLSLIMVFVFAILDALNPVGWSIYYYITYTWVALATLFAYNSYAKEK